MPHTIKALAEALYKRHVTDAGYDDPTTLAQLQAIIIDSGASLSLCADSPSDFRGLWVSDTLYINARMPSVRMVRICAHEWAHYLRQHAIEDEPLTLRFYPRDIPDAPLDFEDLIACEFEKLFL